jgi:hypothetical protein
MPVFNSVVIRASQLVKPLHIAAVTAVLYWSWLVAPVLDYLAENEWRAPGFCSALIAGILIGFWSFDSFAAACATIIGLLFGGTWTELLIPTDVPISFTTAATAHIKSFWLDVILVTLLVTISASSSSRVAKRRIWR